jgi:hypothetical protein
MYEIGDVRRATRVPLTDEQAQQVADAMNRQDLAEARRLLLEVRGIKDTRAAVIVEKLEGMRAVVEAREVTEPLTSVSGPPRSEGLPQRDEPEAPETVPSDSGPRRFIAGFQAQGWGQVHYQGWADSLSVEEITPLLDATLAKRPVPEPVIVYRRYGELFLTNRFPIFSVNETQMKRLEGQTFTDPGFSSTSLTSDNPERRNRETRNGLVAEIQVPAGANGAYTELIHPVEDERELTLARNMAFTIMEVYTDPRGQLRMRLDVTGQGYTETNR